MKITQWTPQVPIDPKSPFAIWSAAKQDCPRPALGNIQVMSFVSLGYPPRTSFDFKSPFGSHIRVMTLEDDRHKIASMIVKISFIVASDPVMDSDGKIKKNECPTIKVRTLR
jgi:hypothetical protein